jgi:succinyl-diaminopimelate desuccinylase
MTSGEERILAALDSIDVTSLLRDLVAVPSSVGDEGRLAEAVGEMLLADGFDVRYQDVEGSRRNVIGAFRFPSSGPRLMFNGHLDTVAAAAGWESDPLTAVQRDGRLYGLGALDMKGGIAASLAACRALIASGVPRCGSIMFSGVIDEEGCSSGARALVDQGGETVDAIIIGEPCAGTTASPIPTLTPGKVLYRLTVEGIQAHGFMPHEGVNAVEEAARIIASLDRLAQAEHPRLGKGPVSTLKIAGGYREYAVVVPDRCEAIISRMIVPGETSGGCKADLEALIDSLDLDGQATVEMVPPYYAPLETDTSTELFRVFEDVYATEYGRTPTYGPSVVITDASVFSGIGGIPTLVFGPTGSSIHQANEYVDLAALAACARTYALTAARFLNHSPEGESHD